MNSNHTCPRCAARLSGSFERPLKVMPEPERTLCHGDTWIVREAVGVEVIGECPEHGLVRYVPMTTPREFSR